MDNILGKNITQYKNVIIRNSTIGDNVILGDDSFITDSNIANACKIERRGMVVCSSVGNYTYTGPNTSLNYADIGKFCSISYNVNTGGPNHEYTTLSTHPFYFLPQYGFVKEKMGEYASNKLPCVIGNDVWIAANASITRGVTISDGAIVGAGAVVTKDIPPYEIWAGVPAKKIGQRFSDEIIAHLLELKWWDLPEKILKENIEISKKCYIRKYRKKKRILKRYLKVGIE